jgi:steroid delta-isomerase-like uncharacterized protein
VRDALVERFIEWWNNGDTAIADEIYADDYVRHADDTPGAGREPVKGLVAAFRRAFPDLRLEVQDVISERDRVVVRWQGTGTHTGEFLGIAPTGRAGSLPGCDILRVENGRIAESWPFYDRLTMLEQMKPA